ncbi:hypothetical protein [Opitutus sp. GAS368]|uniref:hypothetical protein n=1 Tax=Opitutus sp. GAS368 TaxID=1882749 RepID=UPI0012FDBC13|nr:hypothetical protein [Opitutus sp. GAS368]
MTRDDLQRRIADYRKEGRWNALVFFTLLFGVLVGDAVAPQDSLAARIFSHTFYPVGFGLFPVMIVYSLLRIWMKGLVCSHCGARLMGELGEKAISTGRCWKCESKIFEE